MTRENIFDSKLRAMTEEQDREAACSEEDALDANVRYMTVKGYEGVEPEMVWVGDERRLCSDFIDYVQARDFRAATSIEEVQEGELVWSIKGYGIGAYWHDRPRTSLPFNVFLCEDKRLRTWVSDADTVSPLQPMSDRPIEEEIIKPTSVDGLPAVDRSGNLLPPAIGHFVLDRAGPTYRTLIKGHYEPNSEGTGEHWEPDLRQEILPAHDYVYFEVLELEFLLTAHATAAAFGPEELTESQAAAIGRMRSTPLPPDWLTQATDLTGS